MPEIVKSLRWQDLLDILLVSYLVYRALIMIKGTRAAQMLSGIAVLILMYFIARELELLTLYWVLRTLLSSILLITVIVFQRDIRRALTKVGRTPFAKPRDETAMEIDVMVSTATALSERRIGGIIILECDTGLGDYIESGRPVDAALSRDLLLSIFLPSSPLHDGGVIIRKGRITTAACVLPLSRNPRIDQKFGTRHRAAIGLSEETDALIVVISEENQAISLVHDGTIITMPDANTLRRSLTELYSPMEFQKGLWKNWFAK